MTVFSALPTYVPAGRYLCEVKADPVQKASQFAEGKFYLELALQIQDSKGQWFEYPLATNLKSPKYHQILQICGGRILANGVTEGPETLIGKRFVAKIGERLSRDKLRTVNELLEVAPYVPKKNTTALEEPADDEPILSDEGDTVPF